jgi:hypothetical protein
MPRVMCASFPMDTGSIRDHDFNGLSSWSRIRTPGEVMGDAPRPEIVPGRSGRSRAFATERSPACSPYTLNIGEMWHGKSFGCHRVWAVDAPSAEATFLARETSVLSPVLLPFLAYVRCGWLARAAALTILTFGLLSAKAAPPPGSIRNEARDNTGFGNTLRNSLTHSGDQDARRLTRLADPIEAVAWRSLDGASASHSSSAPVAGRDPSASSDSPAVRTQLGQLTDQWTRSPNWARELDSVRREGISLLRTSSHSRMVLSLGSGRRKIAGIYLVQSIAP